ncbi:MAG TPA: pentapeptide repeat-containing protein [Bryobacteraceae bacterium]|nr:pentapeptide repeat-containing protein [Bryobacteraceae bacterium]
MLPFLFALAGIAAQVPSQPAQLTPVVAVALGRTAAVDSIKAGNHDCPHCDLAGADLTNTCVKEGNLQGANFDGARAVLMCMSFADFRGASFRNTDLAGANLAHAKVDGADFTGADLSITSIKGTDLSHAHGLTQLQLDRACGDSETKVPAGLTVKFCS